MEFLAELIIEVLIQGCGELLVDALFNKVKVDRGFLRAFFYAVIGAIAGGLSLLVVRGHIIDERSVRLLYLLIVPILLGLVMRFLGQCRRRRGRESSGLEQFWSGWAFAIAFGAVRICFAK